jgi:hypothetical protein
VVIITTSGSTYKVHFGCHQQRCRSLARPLDSSGDEPAHATEREERSLAFVQPIRHIGHHCTRRIGHHDLFRAQRDAQELDRFAPAEPGSRARACR